MLKRVILFLALLLICETALAKCELKVKNRGERINMLGDRFSIRVDSDTKGPHNLFYKILHVSPSLGGKDEYALQRAKQRDTGEFLPPGEGIPIKKNMIVKIVRKYDAASKIVNFKNPLPAGEYYIKVELTVECNT